MFWLKIIRDFFKILREGQTPGQIAGGFALGSILGFSPMLTLQGIVVWLVLLVLDVNLSAALLSLTLCSIIAYLFDPVFHWIGFQLLVNVESLRPFWTWMYNVPVAPLSRFYNTVVLGSFVAALILFTPIFLGMKRFVVVYRTHIHSRVEKWKLFQVINRSSLVRWYQKIRDIRG